MAILKKVEDAADLVATTRMTAREIMRANCIDIDDSFAGFRILMPEDLRRMFDIVPWPQETLEAVKETHILVATLPLSIMDLRGILGNRLFCECQDDEWYAGKAFAWDRGMPGWHLVRKDAVPESVGKSWADQQAMIQEDEMVPSARVMVYTAISHYLRSGRSLFEDTYVRCAESEEPGTHVSVAVLHSTQLHTDHPADDNLYVALGSAKKPLAA